MINRDNSVIFMPFGSTVTSVGHEVFLLTFTEPNIALCQRERQSKRQAGEAVIQSEVLRISPGSSSFSNYPPGGILVVLDNNGSPGVRLSPLKCGWRKPTRGAGQRNVCFSVMSSEEHTSGATLCCLRGRCRNNNCFFLFKHVTPDLESVQLCAM